MEVTGSGQFTGDKVEDMEIDDSLYRYVPTERSVGALGMLDRRLFAYPTCVPPV